MGWQWKTKSRGWCFLTLFELCKGAFPGKNNRYEICHSGPCGDCNLMPSGIRPHAMLGIVYHARCLSIKNVVVGQYQNTMKPQRRRKLPVRSFVSGRRTMEDTVVMNGVVLSLIFWQCSLWRLGSAFMCNDIQKETKVWAVLLGNFFVLVAISWKQSLLI